MSRDKSQYPIEHDVDKHPNEHGPESVGEK